MDFTEKQKELVRMLKRGELHRLNILYGSVRSGKTWITLLVFALWVLQQPKEKAFIMCAKTLTSLKRNCLDLLQDMIGEELFSYSLSAKSGVLFGRKVYLEGANDSRAESKIRGMTLQGAYVDEITLVESDFFTMLLSRLSEPGAKLFGSTNPDSISHWLKTDYIDRAGELDLYVEKFGIEDNSFLDPEYVRQIKAEYTGVFYDRFILGNFCLAEGLIYPMWESAVIDAPPQGQARRHVISIDYGTMNAFAALDCAERDGGWVVEREYYYSGRDEGKTKTDEEYAQALDAFIEPLQKPVRVIIDPSAASFIALLQKRGHRYKVTKADNDVLDGIRETATALQTGKVKVCRACRNWINEAQSYVWDEDAGEDRPVKENDHAQDALRYFCKTLNVARPERAHLSW